MLGLGRTHVRNILYCVRIFSSGRMSVCMCVLPWLLLELSTEVTRCVTSDVSIIASSNCIYHLGLMYSYLHCYCVLEFSNIHLV